jgi:large subunit ribosomal protein L4
METKKEIKNEKVINTPAIDLPKDIFEVPMNTDLIHQVVVSQMSNRRVAIAHTKGRSEVRGGGIKPWKQKGTGRARHGSIASPIWIGGGVTHGPTKERNFKKILPKNIKRKALFIALSDKAKNNLFITTESLDLEKIKTKDMIKFLNGLGIKGSCLIILPKMNNNVILSTRNIPKIKTIQAKDLNCLDVVSSKYLLTDKEGVEVIKETFKR